MLAERQKRMFKAREGAHVIPPCDHSESDAGCAAARILSKTNHEHLSEATVCEQRGETVACLRGPAPQKAQFWPPIMG